MNIQLFFFVILILPSSIPSCSPFKLVRILIVSDDDNLNFIKNHLEEKGNIVDITDNTKEVLKNIGKYKYDFYFG